MASPTTQSVEKLRQIQMLSPLALIFLALTQFAVAQVPNEYLEALKGRHTDLTVDQAILQIVAGRYPQSGRVLAEFAFNLNDLKPQQKLKKSPKSRSQLVYQCGNDSHLVQARIQRRKREKLLFEGLKELGTQSLLEALAVAERSSARFEKQGGYFNATFEARLVRELSRSDSREVKLRLMRLETSCANSGRHRQFTHKAVLEFLANSDPIIALPRLASALNAPHDSTKFAAIEVLKTMNQPQVDTILLDFVLRATDDQRVWQSALRVLGENKVQAAVPELLVALRSKNVISRQIAAQHLGQMSDHRCLEPLITTLANDPAPSVRLRAALALADYGDQQAIQALKRALKDRNKAVRNSAERALKRLEK